MESESQTRRGHGQTTGAAQPYPGCGADRERFPLPEALPRRGPAISRRRHTTGVTGAAME